MKMNECLGVIMLLQFIVDYDEFYNFCKEKIEVNLKLTVTVCNREFKELPTYIVESVLSIFMYHSFSFVLHDQNQ